MSDHILSAAYTATILSRTRVRQLLAQYAELPLILLEAPAGYGKSTAIADYLQEREGPAIWLNLSPRDNEPALFMRHLSAAFRQGGLAFSLPGDSSLSNNYSFWNIEEQLRQFCARQPLYMLLDDYHYIENSQIDRFVEDMARLRIKNLHIYVLSRARPEFSVTDMLLKNVAALVEAQELCFTAQEIEDYLQFQGLPGDRVEAERILRHTEGWPAAVRLLANARRQGQGPQARPNMAADINNLFEKEIFSRLDQDTRIFLLRISILDEFQPHLAAYVSGFDSAARMLNSLAHNSLLATYDQEKDTYYFNRLFLNYLRRQNHLVEKSERLRLQELAGEYYFEQQDYGRALKFFLAREDYDKMAISLSMLLAQRVAMTRQRSRELLEYIAKMPEDYRLKYPAVGLGEALCYLALEERDACREVLLKLGDSYLQDLELPFRMREKLLAEVEILRALMKFNDMPQLAAGARRGLAALGKEGFPCHLPLELLFSIPSPLLTYYSRPGQLGLELEQVADHSHLLQSLFPGQTAGLPELLAAESAYWRGSLEEGEDMAATAMWLAGQQGNYQIPISAQFILLRCAILKGNLSGCRQALAEIVRLGRQAQHPLAGVAADISCAFYYMAVGDFAALPSWIHPYHGEIGHCLGSGSVLEYIICARCAAAQKQYSQLENLARHILGLARQGQALGAEITALIFLAGAAFHNGRLAEAAGNLRQGWQLAQEDKLIAPFLEESALLLPLLQKLAAQGPEQPDQEWAARLLPQLKAAQRKGNQLMRAYGAALSAAAGQKNLPPIVALSRREKQVLHYLQQGVTGREMAQMMGVSANNVKGISTRVYNKLSVSNKTEAIRVAQELGLLS